MIVDISEIKENPNNPRFIKDNEFKKLVKSIKEFPEMLSIRKLVCNQDMVVLGGNMRLRALREAKIQKVDVDIVDWDLDKQRQFVIVDNLSYGEWNHEQLANEWDAIELQDWGLELPVDFNAKLELDATDKEYTDKSSITLNYTIEEHAIVSMQLERIAKTPEQAVWMLLGNK